MKPVISGIQQVGIGVADVQGAFNWYRKNLGMDIKMFEEAADAELMLPYTGGEPRSRHAILALNLQGGGGLEIWQYTSRTPEGPKFEIQLGDLGMSVLKFKTRDVEEAYDSLKNKGVVLLSEPVERPDGQLHFFARDPWGNILNIVPSRMWFKKEKAKTGGAFGVFIGVTDMERSRKFYSEILGYDTVMFEGEGTFEDLKGLPGGEGRYKRVLLRHSKQRKGPFSPVLGSSEIELFQALDREPRKVFENRFWGDLGFIHLCYDIVGMEELKAKCEAIGHPFTVDSANSFDMGEAAGRFSYIEDPDGTLIEFVETHKIPVAKKVGWYLNLKGRNPEKPLSNFVLKALGMNRVRD